MTPEVQERIRQISNGEIPEGYKKTKFGILPTDWKVVTIGECLERVEHPVDVQPDQMYTQIGIRSHGKGLFYKEPVSGAELGNKSVYWIEPDCFILNIVFAWEQAIARTTQAEVGMIGSHRFPMYKPVKDLVDIDYLVYFFQTKRGTDILEAASPGGAGRNRTLGQDRFMKSKIVLPSIREQKKIVDVIKTQDSIIQLQDSLIKNTICEKKYLLSKLFPSKNQVIPELRFRWFSNSWERHKFGELYSPLSERNTELLPYDYTLSVATMVYKSDGNGAATESLANYKRLRLGDVAFEGHTNKECRFGRFVINDVGDGIMSPRFTALRPKQEMAINFWKNYFQCEPIMKRILVRSTKAGTMMNELVHKEFAQESIEIPSRNEQIYIGSVFSTFDNTIELLQNRLEQEKCKKKALIQLLLAGIVRV